MKTAEKRVSESQHRIGWKNWLMVWVIGMAGQIAWNVENTWFNEFIYHIFPNQDYEAFMASVVAWMVAVSATCTTVVTFVFGTLSDRVGKRKPFIVIGYLFWGLSTIAFGLTETIYHSLQGLAGVMMIMATVIVAADAIMSMFGSLGNDSGFNAWTTDISDEVNRGKITGVIAIMPVLATVVGTIGSGIIIDNFGYFVFFISMGILVMVIGVVAAIFMKDAPDLKPRKEGTFWQQFTSVFNFNLIKKNAELFLVLLFVGVYFIGFNIFYPYMLPFMQETIGLDATQSGIILGAGLTVASLIAIPSAKLIEKGHLSVVILGAIAANTLGLIITWLSGTSLVLLAIGVFFVGIGYIAVIQTTMAWMKNLYPADQRGQFEGIRIIAFVLIPMVFGPMIGTAFIGDALPGHSLFGWSIPFMLLSIIPLYFLNRKHVQNRKEESLEEPKIE
jgi:MFS family permease